MASLQNSVTPSSNPDRQPSSDQSLPILGQVVKECRVSLSQATKHIDTIHQGTDSMIRGVTSMREILGMDTEKQHFDTSLRK